MGPGEVILTLLQLLHSNNGTVVQPSLASLNFDFSDASLLRVENFSVNIARQSPHPLPSKPFPAMIETSRGAKLEFQIAQTSAPNAPDPPPNHDHPGPLLCRVEPHLIFGHHVETPGEFQIAPRLKVVLIQDADNVAFTLLTPGKYIQRLYLNPAERSRPVALELGGKRICFNGSSHVTWRNDPKQRWSFKPFVLNRPKRIDKQPASATESDTLVTVVGDIYDAAWLLTRRDLRKKGIFPEHYLLLRERAIGVDDVKGPDARL